MMCAWCVRPVHPEAPYASRTDGEVWHAECFLKYLAHQDDLAGIVRGPHSLHQAKLDALYCPRCLGPMVRDVKIEQHEDGAPMIETEVFQCAAGCEFPSPPEPQERV